MTNIKSTHILMCIFGAVLFCVLVFGDRGTEGTFGSETPYKNSTYNYCKVPIDSTVVTFDINFENLVTVEDSIDGVYVEAVTFRPNNGKDYPMVNSGQQIVHLNYFTGLSHGVDGGFIVNYSDGSVRRQHFEFDVVEVDGRCVYSERNLDMVVENNTTIPVLF